MLTGGVLTTSAVAVSTSEPLSLYVSLSLLLSSLSLIVTKCKAWQQSDDVDS